MMRRELTETNTHSGSDVEAAVSEVHAFFENLRDKYRAIDLGEFEVVDKNALYSAAVDGQQGKKAKKPSN
jgi:hypothetical protein